MASDVARAQEQARLTLARDFLNQAARMLERVRDAAADPADRRWIDTVLERLAIVAATLERDLAADPAAGDVDQATSFGAGWEEPS